MHASGTIILEHESEQGSWLIARRDPAAALRPYVALYSGYREHNRHFEQHLQTASSRIPLVLNLGPRYRVDGPAERGVSLQSFVAGLHDGPVLVGAEGPQHCLQVDLTPLGARRLLGLPMRELSNRSVELGDIVGPAAAELLVERLWETPEWDARFALVEEVIAARLGQTVELPAQMVYAWELLERDGGRTAIAGLADELGWSSKHLIAQFHEHVGLPPKKLARILRFERALAALRPGGEACLATLARTAGYFDQAHLNRDFRQFAGLTPTDYLRRRLPEMDGLIAD